MNLRRGGGYDFILRKGKLVAEKPQETIMQFTRTDVFLKGANAIDAIGEAAVLAAGAEGGTIGYAFMPTLARQANLIISVGLEKMLRRLLGKDIRLTIGPGPRPALVRFEIGQLEQIVMALAVRAREAMPGGGAFTVTVGDVESLPPNGILASVPDEKVGGIVVRSWPTRGSS